MISNNFKYDEDDHENYEEMGYALWRPFLAPDSIFFLIEQVDRILARKHESVSSEWIMNAHLVGEEWLLELAMDSKLLDAVERFCGHDITLLQTHLFCKAQGSAPTPWHQDGSCDTNIPLATIWIPLDDLTTPLSGSLLVLPRLHKRNLLPSVKGDHFQFDRVLSPSFVDKQEIYRYPLQAGEAAIHHQWLPHASESNEVLPYRRVIVLRYISTKVLEHEGVPLWRVVQPASHEANYGETKYESVGNSQETSEGEMYPDLHSEDVYFEGKNVILRGRHCR